MIVTLDHNSALINVDTELIAYVFDDGVGVYVSMLLDPYTIRQLGLGVADIYPDPAAGYGYATILVRQLGMALPSLAMLHSLTYG